MTRVELPALIWAMDRGREAFERIQAGGCDEGDAVVAKLWSYVLELHRQRVGPQIQGPDDQGGHG